MSDHIDGPRTTADPSIDITDLFAFRSPSNANKTVIAATFFPFSGERSLFSNAASYNFVISPVKVTGLGRDAGFEPHGKPLRFRFEFDLLGKSAKTNDDPPKQTGKCFLPNGKVIPLVVGYIDNSKRAHDSIHAFAGVRSDPFFLCWDFLTLKKTPNLLQGDNVLGIVLELDLQSFFPLYQGGLFGITAETEPKNKNSFATKIPRYDWVGRPEQTNFIFSMLPNTIDIKDLWNQQEPFGKIPADELDIFERYMVDSLRFWDMRDDVKNWDEDKLKAHARIRLNDFLLIDVNKPTDDNSHLEIEKQAIAGLPHNTGGGRTINANVIDILITYLVNRDDGPFYFGGASQATKPGTDQFPYLAPANTNNFTVTKTVDLKTNPKNAWKLISNFGALWHPMVSQISVIGSGIGQIRKVETVDGNVIIEQLTELNNANYTLKYSLISGIPATNYVGFMHVAKTSYGCAVTWTVNYRPLGQGEIIVNYMISTIVNTGLKALQAKFGAPNE